MISIIYGALAVGVAMVLAFVGVILVQSLVPSVQRQEHNDVAGFIYAVIGVVYAVLLALVVIAGWENHQLAKETTERGKRAGRYLLARTRAPGNRGTTTLGTLSIIRSNGGEREVGPDGARTCGPACVGALR